MVKRSARSRAAVQGWQTRRANAARRSEAAAKGWQTRRRHERQAERKRAERNAKRREREQRKRKPPGGDRGKKRPPPKPPGQAEYAVSADYTSRKAGSAVSIQLSIFGPPHATRANLEAAIRQRAQTGVAPAGYDVQIVDWRGRSRARTFSQGDAWRNFRKPLAESDVSTDGED